MTGNCWFCCGCWPPSGLFVFGLPPLGAAPLGAPVGLAFGFTGAGPGTGYLAGRIPDEFPLLVGVAPQVNPQGRLLDLAADADDVAAEDVSFKRLRLGL